MGHAFLPGRGWLVRTRFGGLRMEAGILGACPLLPSRVAQPERSPVRPWATADGQAKVAACAGCVDVAFFLSTCPLDRYSGGPGRWRRHFLNAQNDFERNKTDHFTLGLADMATCPRSASGMTVPVISQ